MLLSSRQARPPGLPKLADERVSGVRPCHEARGSEPMSQRRAMRNGRPRLLLPAASAPLPLPQLLLPPSPCRPSRTNGRHGRRWGPRGRDCSSCSARLEPCRSDRFLADEELGRHH
eukprot:190722-Hanusia_phi.AAC.4